LFNTASDRVFYGILARPHVAAVLAGSCSLSTIGARIRGRSNEGAAIGRSGDAAAGARRCVAVRHSAADGR
jgi:hypothetical protein